MAIAVPDGAMFQITSIKKKRDDQKITYEQQQKEIWDILGSTNCQGYFFNQISQMDYR